MKVISEAISINRITAFCRTPIVMFSAGVLSAVMAGQGIDAISGSTPFTHADTKPYHLVADAGHSMPQLPPSWRFSPKSGDGKITLTAIGGISGEALAPGAVRVMGGHGPVLAQAGMKDAGSLKIGDMLTLITENGAPQSYKVTARREPSCNIDASRQPVPDTAFFDCPAAENGKNSQLLEYIIEAVSSPTVPAKPHTL